MVAHDSDQLKEFVEDIWDIVLYKNSLPNKINVVVVLNLV